MFNKVTPVWNIARQYHVGVDEIRKANPGIDEMNLQVEQLIKIPNASRGPSTHLLDVQVYRSNQKSSTRIQRQHQK